MVDADMIVQVANGVRSIIAGVPGLKEAAHEVVSHYITDPLKLARRVKNLEREREFAEKMIKGHTLIDNPSTKNAERILKAASEEDRELLQKMWAALIARLVTGQLPTIRNEWIEIIKNLEPIDAGILEILPNVRVTGNQGNIGVFTDVMEKDLREKFPQYPINRDDITLSLNTMIGKGLVVASETLFARPDGTWTPPRRLTLLGKKILEITRPPTNQ